MKILITLFLFALASNQCGVKRYTNCVSQDGELYCYVCNGTSCELESVKPDPKFTPLPRPTPTLK